MKYKNWIILLLAAVSVVSFLILKPEKMRNSSLERVAKDWAYVIRACQVIPIYPLSEDLQPGDVLLVSTPVEQQVKIYNEKGFLPIDQHLIRLYPSEFGSFYKSRYGINNNSCPATDWQSTDSSGQTRWNTAPHVAFPPYHFSVSTGSGTNIALPVKGVPVALGIMNSGKASGTLTITDAFTYGMDNYHLSMQVKQWADEQRSFLRNYEPKDKLQQYLRVVSRVYIASKVDITISNGEASSSKLSLFKKKVKTDPDLSAKDTSSAENTDSTAINGLSNKNKTDANIDIATASSRVVTLSERFPKPLVIGYVGFDMPILKGGRLGVPISTVNQLAGMKQEMLVKATDNFALRLTAITFLYKALKDDARVIDGARRLLTKLDQLDTLLPMTYPIPFYEMFYDDIKESDILNVRYKRGDTIAHMGFESIISYLYGLDQTIAIIKKSGMATPPNQTTELFEAETIYDRFANRALTHPDVIDALDRILYQTY